MALISSASKSGRLLASRRYTHETLNDAQESFTNVLDLQATEIYTQAGYLPSSGLPFSGSTQINATHTVSGSSVLKYWYRHKLTKSNTNNETWFFLSPSGSDSGVGAQLISDDQEVNFVSPKYSISTLATTTTADSTPGYLATLYKSSAVSNSIQTGSLDGDDIVSTNDYIFDYKTGVIEFKNSSVDPTNSEYLYMTVYQYTGTTSATGIDVRGNVTGSDIYSTGTLDIDGATTLNSTLDVDGATTLNGTVTLGNATGDTITATGRFNTDIVPSTDSARDLGTSTLQFAEAHIDTGYIDSLTTTTNVDIDDSGGDGAMDGVIIGAATAAAGTFTTLNTTGLTTIGDASGDTLTINAATINPTNIAAGTDNTVVVYNGSTLLTDEIDSKVWDGNLVDTDGSGANNELATWSDSDSIIGEGNLTFDGSTLAVTGAVTVSGNLEVNGTTTYISSSQVDIGDRILTLNAQSVAGDGGLYVNDASGNETGSLLWDVSANRWIGGLKDSEYNILYATGDSVVSSSAEGDAQGQMKFNGVNVDTNALGSGDSPTFGTITANTGIVPDANDGAYLGQAGTAFSDLFLAEGAVINWDSGDFTATQANNLLTLSGGNTRVDRLEIDSAADYLDVSTDLQIIAAADITLNPGGNNVKPGGDSQDDLGVSGTAWRKLFVDDIELNSQGSITNAVSASIGYISGSGDMKIDGGATFGGGYGSTGTTISSAGVLQTDGAITAGGNVTAVGSFVIGSADMSETDLEKLDGITNGAGAANKALVLDGSSDITSGINNLLVSRLEIDADTNYIDVSTDLQIIAAADIKLDPAGGEVDVDGNLIPNSDSADDLGASGQAWNKLWVDDIDLNAQGSISIGGTGRIDLDADDDTSIRASADDVITFEAGAVDIAQMTSTMAISGSSVSTGSLGQLNIASSGSVYIPDSVRVNFGDSNDLKIYHSGNHSIIQDTGTGNLRIKGSIINIQGTSTAEDIAKFTENAGAELYYDDSKKFETSNTGITITGDMGATISGSSVSTGSFGYLNVVGDGVIGGNLTFGDAATDSVSFGADITSHLIPDADATYNLGSSSQGWNDLHLGEGGVINWDNGDATLTQASNVVTLAGATLTLSSGLTNGLSVTANGGILMTSYDASAAVADLALDIDGMTDIGAAVADGDLLAIDDGAGGTNRKVTVDRLATYVSSSAFAKVSGDITVTGAGVATIAATSVEGSMLNDNVISGQGALGGASVAQADLLMIDDGPGTVKKVTFSNFEDSIFNNISGDIAIAAGGAAVVTGATTNAALTAGAGLSAGGTFDGATARTFALDLNEFSSVAVASGDRLATLDSDNSTEQLTTVDDLADYISGSAFSKTGGDITIAGTGVTTIGATKVTGAMLNDDVISAQSNLGSAGVAQADEFMFSDAGTIKALTFSNLEDSIFANIGGDISIAAGGTATVTGATTNAALTAGDGISAGGTFDGATARTFAIDLSEYSDVQIATGDKFLVLDSNNSTEQLESVDDLAAFVSASAFGKVSGDVSITGAGVATVTGATTNAALTAGTGISAGGTFDGATARTFALDLSELSSVAVATGDRLSTLDSDGSNEQLTTVDDLADYVSGSAFGKVSGDITIAGTGVSTIGADTVANTMLENMAANTVKVRNAGDAGDPSDLALATTQILIGDGTGFTAAALSGDVTMTNAGAVSIGATKVTGAMLNDDVISGQSALGSAAMAQADLLLIDDGPATVKKITFSNFEDSIFGNVSGDATIAAGGALTIGNDKIDSQHYAAASIDNEHLADNAVDSAELAAGAVDDAHLSNGVATGLAGTGMTATTGVLNVIGGTGVTANADDIAIGQAVGTGDSPTFTGITATSDVVIQGNLTVTGDRIEAQIGSLQIEDHTITVGSGSTTSATMNQAGLDLGVSGSVAFLRYDHGTTTLSSSVDLTAPQLHSSIATGTAPLTVSSTTVVSNLNADKLDGQEGSYYTDFSNMTVTAGEITHAMLAGDLIDGDNIGDDVINSEHYAAGSIDNEHIADDAIDSEHYAALSIDLGHLAADSVDGSKIVDDAIDSEHYAAGSIDTAHIANDQITADLMADNSINSDMYVDASIDTAHIAGSQITNALMADDAIDSDEIVDGAVDNVHLANSAVTITAGDGLKTGGSVSLGGSVTLDFDASDIADTGIEANGENLRLAAQGTGISGGAGSTLSITPAQTAITSVLNTGLIVGRDADNQIDFGTDNMIKVEVDGVADEFRFSAGGTFHADADIVAFSSTVASDMNLKENITDMKYGLDDIMKLRGVEYDWKREDMGHDLGVLAQEVEAVIPELVKEHEGLKGSGTFKAVDYNKLVPVLIESIKELKSEIDELKKNQN